MDDPAAELVALLDCGREVRALGELREEAAYKGVSGSVGVNYKTGIEGRNFNELHSGLLSWDTSGDDGRLGSLCNDHVTRSVLVRLLEGSDELGDSDAIRCFKAVCFGEGGAFVLVAEDEVGVLEGVLHWVHEELDDEEGGEIEAEGDVIGGGIVAECLHSLSVRIHEESGCVEEAGSADHVLKNKFKRGECEGFLSGDLPCWR